MFISRSMRVFITLYQEKRLKAAADKLCLTVPPVTRMLKLTEEWLGDCLFIIERNNLTPTPAADCLYEKVFPIYSELLQYEHPTQNNGFRISSPDVGKSIFTDLISILPPSLPDNTAIRFSNAMHSDDNVFISIKPPVALPNFEKYYTVMTLELHYSLTEDDDWRNKPLLCEETIEELPNFKRILEELHSCGHCGRTQRIDNINVLNEFFIKGEGIMFRRPNKANGKCRILPYVLHIPLYIYINKINYNSRYEQLYSSLIQLSH